MLAQKYLAALENTYQYPIKNAITIVTAFFITIDIYASVTIPSTLPIYSSLLL